MREENCASCRYWDGEGHITAFCRVMPPLRAIGIEFHSPTGHWPSTERSAWCGSFKPRVKRTAMGDTRPGAATVEIKDNGIVIVTHAGGESFELSSFGEPLDERDKQVIERMAWMTAE